jgi:hypothetical protein
MKNIVLLVILLLGSGTSSYAQGLNFDPADIKKVLVKDEDGSIFRGSREEVIMLVPTTYTQPGDTNFVFLNEVSLIPTSGRNNLQDMFFRGRAGYWTLVVRYNVSTGNRIVEAQQKNRKEVGVTIRTEKGKLIKTTFALPL